MRDIFLFDIRFVDATYGEIRRRLDKGGLMVVPAAPALATLRSDTGYHAALQQSDLAIFDSGLLCILIRVLKGLRVRRLSGLAFLRAFLADVADYAQGQVFLVDPDSDNSALNRSLFRSFGHDVPVSHQYVAPMYPRADSVCDPLLRDILEELQPQYIVISLGGGVQEKLGAYLRQSLRYSPVIICTGAAIAFMTGTQVGIPPLLDRLYLGWLARCLADPRRFVPRYLSGFRLIPMVLACKPKESKL